VPSEIVIDLAFIAIGFVVVATTFIRYWRRWTDGR
jgi:hypothetical protein